VTKKIAPGKALIYQGFSTFSGAKFWSGFYRSARPFFRLGQGSNPRKINKSTVKGR